jgi:hypothetical protein
VPGRPAACASRGTPELAQTLCIALRGGREYPQALAGAEFVPEEPASALRLAQSCASEGPGGQKTVPGEGVERSKRRRGERNSPLPTAGSRCPPYLRRRPWRAASTRGRAVLAAR